MYNIEFRSIKVFFFFGLTTCKCIENFVRDAFCKPFKEI